MFKVSKTLSKGQKMKSFQDRLISVSVVALMITSTVCHGQQSPNAQQDVEGKIGLQELIQYGKMHEVIGLKKHEGRVLLGELTAKPHFYGVGALAGLQGEISIIDSRATVTEVTDAAQAKPANKDSAKRQATMLIGAYVDAWTETVCDRDLTDSELDEWIQSEIARQGGDIKQPLMFLLRGMFSDVHLHVINGACPVHARIRQLAIPESERPFDATLANVSGELVGVFALDAAGKLTHPATSTHKHLVYRDSQSDEPLNGHVESISVKRGAKLMLPIKLWSAVTEK